VQVKSAGGASQHYLLDDGGVQASHRSFPDAIILIGQGDDVLEKQGALPLDVVLQQELQSQINQSIIQLVSIKHQRSRGAESEELKGTAPGST
jgi:hypothetical protein